MYGTTLISDMGLRRVATFYLYLPFTSTYPSPLLTLNPHTATYPAALNVRVVK
jgi:hypothetical protein